MQLEKKAAVLFATDVAARGLDFPHVNWVVQLDCPESTESYIHRVGRTARYRNKGNGLLVLLPSERKMVAALKDARIPLKQIKVRRSRTCCCPFRVSLTAYPLLLTGQCPSCCERARKGGR